MSKNGFLQIPTPTKRREKVGMNDNGISPRGRRVVRGANKRPTFAAEKVKSLSSKLA